MAHSMDSNEGPKSGDKDFAKILRKSKIFCLQETINKYFSLLDYRCFNSLRKDSRSGGLRIGIHRSLEDKIKPIAIDSPDLQAFSLRLSGRLYDHNGYIDGVHDCD